MSDKQKATAKTVAKKAKPLAKPSKGALISGIGEAKFVSLKVRAVIPTQQYGNIQPEIEVQAPTYEMARDFVMPRIEELYTIYAERPVNGTLPKFVGPVTVEEKVVVPQEDIRKNMENVPSKSVTAPASPETTAAPVVENSIESQIVSEAGLKAKRMIEHAQTREALNLVEQKIKDSVKIPADEKPILYTIVLKKQKEF